MGSTNTGYVLPQWIPAVMHPTLQSMLDKSEKLQDLPQQLDDDSVVREDIKTELLIKHYLEEIEVAGTENRQMYFDRIFTKLIDTLKEDSVIREAHLGDSEWEQFSKTLYQLLSVPHSADLINITRFRRAVWSYRMGVLLGMSPDEIKQAVSIIIWNESYE